MTHYDEPPADLAGRCQTLIINQRQALLSSVARLRQEFDGTFDWDTLQQHVYAAYARLAAHGETPKYLPQLAERSARMVLREQAGRTIPDGSA
jgi:hypothetical protein